LNKLSNNNENIYNLIVKLSSNTSDNSKEYADNDTCNIKLNKLSTNKPRNSKEYTDDDIYELINKAKKLQNSKRKQPPKKKTSLSSIEKYIKSIRKPPPIQKHVNIPEIMKYGNKFRDYVKNDIKINGMYSTLIKFTYKFWNRYKYAHPNATPQELYDGAVEIYKEEKRNNNLMNIYQEADDEMRRLLPKKQIQPESDEESYSGIKEEDRETYDIIKNIIKNREQYNKNKRK